MKKILFSLLALIISASIYAGKAYDIAVKNADGVTIYYNYINDNTELAVTFSGSQDYQGNIVIPEEVTYMNRTRKVTSIGRDAFCDCSGLTSITIPNSVTSIGSGAFIGCYGLTTITIPNSVTSIGGNAFWDCSGLTSITIPNSVKSIGSGAFLNCSGLTSVTIPNSVTSIGHSAFSGCSNLTSVTIPNIVTSIGDYTFRGCRALVSVTIPNSVTSIGHYAFSGCSGLTSITIPNSVTSIGWAAFSGADIPTVVSLIENPFSIEGKKSSSSTFSQNTFLNATLYVPRGTIEKYKATEGWKDFVFIEEGAGEGGNPPMPKYCAKPIISYSNGQLKFECETEGVEYHSSITNADIKDYTTGVIDLSVTYNIRVYATKEGYENSEVATATLCWIDVEPWAEGTKEAEDGVTEVKAIPVLIQAEGNTISVQGAAEGTDISVYNTAGIKLCSAIANKGITTLNTTLPSGSTAIVKIGEKSVKVLVK